MLKIKKTEQCHTCCNTSELKELVRNSRPTFYRFPDGKRPHRHRHAFGTDRIGLAGSMVCSLPGAASCAISDHSAKQKILFTTNPQGNKNTDWYKHITSPKLIISTSQDGFNIGLCCIGDRLNRLKYYLPSLLRVDMGRALANSPCSPKTKQSTARADRFKSV